MKTAVNYKQKLIDKINSYKSYNKQVKDRVLAQIDPNRKITEKAYKEILKRVPAVMKANAEFVKRYNRAHKQAVALEKHDYAPELNKVWFKGGVAVKAAGSRTLEAAIGQIVNLNWDLIKDRV